jgi:signal transduction histidine kinase
MAKEKEEKDTKKGSYSAQDITVLEGLEPVRKRPGMYIGTTGPDGLHHLITEIFDNSRDEAMGGFCNDIEIALLPQNRVRVVDNGIGVPKAEQEHLFTKFFRAANARKQRPDGTGVGIFLAKKVVNEHGGTIIFESVEGKGSTFGFILPVSKLRPK